MTSTTTDNGVRLATVFTTAAMHIELVGHHRGEWFADAGSFIWPGDYLRAACCADGALCAAVGFNPEESDPDDAPRLLKDARQALAEHLGRLGWEIRYTSLDEINTVDTIGDWNDHPEIDGPEIARVLREVAELERTR